jgi:hypothetical protein
MISGELRLVSREQNTMLPIPWIIKGICFERWGNNNNQELQLGIPRGNKIKKNKKL